MSLLKDKLFLLKYKFEESVSLSQKINIISEVFQLIRIMDNKSPEANRVFIYFIHQIDENGLQYSENYQITLEILRKLKRFKNDWRILNLIPLITPQLYDLFTSNIENILNKQTDKSLFQKIKEGFEQKYPNLRKRRDSPLFLYLIDYFSKTEKMLMLKSGLKIIFGIGGVLTGAQILRDLFDDSDAESQTW